ncbi:beta-galactosidase [Paenibacillus xanthanilyticus]|uniref:Beta-galactosidase n=1 Tax=Paenibacillus xanthanilyticus TaxID=1783531 RepID=A0ABV8JYA5_9BACL
MIYGACYYPEHWPEERWPLDARLMREAGLNVARIGEFAWSKLERREGEYDFGWLDRILDVLGAEGIRVVLGTPTATPPKWLMDKHPDIYMQDYKGGVRGFGNRRHYCFNNETYHRCAQAITERLANRYGNHPSVTGWQIDNEFGCNETTRCYCERCKRAFHRWLARKYGDVDAMNESWGTVFWSQTYNDWHEVTLPGYAPFHLHNPGLALDYRRFASEAVVAFQQLQLDILKRLAPSQPATHNLMGAFNEIDGYELARNLDFVSWDSYPNLHFDATTDPSRAAAQHDMTRGLKHEPFWVMEHQSGPPGGDILFQTPKPGELRRWTYQSVAHGADAIVYFRWRTCLFGAEQFWHGILPHDGLPGRRYDEVKRTGEELRLVMPAVQGSGPGAEVAIIRSYDNEWATEIQPLRPGYSYMEHLLQYYRHFYENHIPVDIVSDETDFSRYKLIVLPHYMMTRPETAERLYAYVKAGGTAVLDYRAGSKLWNNRMDERPLPGAFRELAGIRIADYGTLRPEERLGLRSHPVAVAEAGEGDGTGEGTTWFDVIEAETAETLLRYEDDYMAGQAAATRNRYGEGRVYYIGTDPDRAVLGRLLGQAAADAGVNPIGGIIVPEGVELARRRTPDGDILFVLNHGGTAREIELTQPFDDLLEQRSVPVGKLVIEPEGVFVLATARAE